MRTDTRCRRKRRGAAAVEFALTVPVVFLFFAASVEFGRIYMVRQTLENTVYEAARLGLVSSTADDQIKAAATNMLNTINVKNPDIQVAQDSTSVTVTISLQVKDSAWIPPVFFKSGKLSSSLTMKKDKG